MWKSACMLLRFELGNAIAGFARAPMRRPRHGMRFGKHAGASRLGLRVVMRARGPLRARGRGLRLAAHASESLGQHVRRSSHVVSTPRRRGLFGRFACDSGSSPSFRSRSTRRVTCWWSGHGYRPRGRWTPKGRRALYLTRLRRGGSKRDRSSTRSCDTQRRARAAAGASYPRRCLAAPAPPVVPPRSRSRDDRAREATVRTVPVVNPGRRGRTTQQGPPARGPKPQTSTCET
jgi:hypothetical protein